MTTWGWIVLGIMAAIIVALAIVAWCMLSVAGDLLSGFIGAFGWPDSRRKKRRS